MVTVVVVINVLIGLACLFAAWQVWKIRRILASVTDTIDGIERSTHAVLYHAPDAVLKGQTGIYQLRGKYQQLQPQLQKLQQVLGLLGLGQVVWRRRSLLTRRASGSRKATAKSR